MDLPMGYDRSLTILKSTLHMPFVVILLDGDGSIQYNINRRQSDGMEDALISHLRRLCLRDWLVTVKYASRTANKTADARARRVAPDTWTAQLFGVPPGDVLQSVEPDRAYGLLSKK
ncbi:hypothetical protein GOBAR_AA30215 [Gossypium barbadense]|uniref:Uncharacterized protein n=1 Tax=Gossypium barbadense TaxID=3634 RepID=A0A2P5WH94_GOSBA|nr:hypothetical protein GOBAR_AA30215 [Gossypium barbadense]